MVTPPKSITSPECPEELNAYKQCNFKSPNHHVKTLVNITSDP